MPALCQTEWESDTISAWNQCGKVRTSGSWRHASQTQCAEFSLPPEGQRGYWTDIRRSISNNSEIWKSNISGILTAPRLLKGKCCFSKVFSEIRTDYDRFTLICTIWYNMHCFRSQVSFKDYFQWMTMKWMDRALFMIMFVILHVGHNCPPRQHISSALIQADCRILDVTLAWNERAKWIFLEAGDMCQFLACSLYCKKDR